MSVHIAIQQCDKILFNLKESWWFPVTEQKKPQRWKSSCGYQ